MFPPLLQVQLIEKLGRRSLLLFPMCLMALSTIIITVALNMQVCTVRVIREQPQSSERAYEIFRGGTGCWDVGVLWDGGRWLRVSHGSFLLPMCHMALSTIIITVALNMHAWAYDMFSKYKP